MFWTLTDFRVWWRSPARFRWMGAACSPNLFVDRAVGARHAQREPCGSILQVGARHVVPLHARFIRQRWSAHSILRAWRGREFTAAIEHHRDLANFGDLL
jgi:hypothetical protein